MLQARPEEFRNPHQLELTIRWFGTRWTSGWCVQKQSKWKAADAHVDSSEWHPFWLVLVAADAHGGS